MAVVIEIRVSKRLYCVKRTILFRRIASKELSRGSSERGVIR